MRYIDPRKNRQVRRAERFRVIRNRISKIRETGFWGDGKTYFAKGIKVGDCFSENTRQYFKGELSKTMQERRCSCIGM